MVDIVGYAKWSQLQEKLRERGFREDPFDDVICRMLIGELKVDFMPVDQNALGFSNRWYKDAVEMTCHYQLTQNVTINLIRPEYFIATKLEAYLGRGNGDLLSSRDIEDILNIFDGRESIVEEISQSSTALKEYISNNLALLINEYDFEMAVQSTSQGIRSREDIIFERLTQCIKH
ncbi:hypothetical protein [Providencia rettgeri]|uniref:hypothetical protein n=1 Tax=Providencia rettgeri TaxID=587 RepID=UPI001FB5D7A1|nr:hypothetical protein [Providencia rettgeri]